MRRLLVSLLAGAALAWPAGAAETPGRSRLAAVAGFFSWRTTPPAALDSALDDYARGAFFAAIGAATVELSRGEATFRDEAHLVRGLALEALRWNGEAAESLRVVLESDPPSPYYPLALLGVVESYRREGRLDAVAEAFDRYFTAPWRGRDLRSRLIRNLLSAYGELREPGRDPTDAPSDLAMHPSRLAEALRNRKERPSERLLYLVGESLFAAGRYAESLDALERIGLVSLYHPYAAYAAAQDLYALGRPNEARRRLESLADFPATTPEESLLADRSRLLLAEVLFELGGEDAALAAAAKVGEAFRAEAGMLAAEICLASAKPSLALAYYRGLEGHALPPALEAGRAIGIAAAYGALRDFASATAALRGAAAEVAARRSRREGASAERERRLRAFAESAAELAIAEDAARRRRTAAGIRRVVSFKGPFNLGAVVRWITTSHRNTILGQPVYDLDLLAAGEIERGAPPSTDAVWLDYLRSSVRPAVDEALVVLARSADGAPEASLHALDGGLKWLEGRFPRQRDGAAEVVAALGVLSAAAGAPLAHVDEASAADIRRRWATASPLGEDRAADRRSADEARSRIRRAVGDSVDRGLERFFAERDASAKRAEYDLAAALSQALAGEAAALAPGRLAR